MIRRAQAKESPGLAEARPVLGSNFLVDFGDGRSREASGGFAEVIFPEFRLGTGEPGPAMAPGQAPPGPAGPESTLILKRGVCGALDLYTWWDQTRKGKAPRKKSLKVLLLSEDQQRVVLTWTFHNVRPVALAYSPLRAKESVVAIETIELTFEGFDLA